MEIREHRKEQLVNSRLQRLIFEQPYSCEIHEEGVSVNLPRTAMPQSSTSLFDVSSVDTRLKRRMMSSQVRKTESKVMLSALDALAGRASFLYHLLA